MSDSPKYVLRLYTADQRDAMEAIVERLREVLNERFPNAHEIEVVDVIADPERALADEVFVTPTTVKALPEPIRRVIGDVRDPAQILMLLGVFAVEEQQAEGK